MNQQRLRNILNRLENQEITQMIITDPYAIYYLTGRFVDPGKRLFALYTNKNGSNRLFLNELFTVPEDLGVEKVWFQDTDDFYHIMSRYTDRTCVLGVDKNMPSRFLLPLMEDKAASNFVNTSLCVDETRACKDEKEQELMRAVSLINDQAMERLADKIYEGISERETAGILDGIYQELGADGLSFTTLVGFGPNAAKGHHEPDNTRLKKGDCVLIDMGCMKDAYCADMTRTYFFQSVNPKHQEIYELVKKANETAEAMIKPGVRFCDIDRAARDIIEQSGFGHNFTHRLGHSIGLEVHEFGDVSSSNTDTVRPGMTFSIEPGIYVSDDVGIRIEDLVLVTETGCEILNHVSKDLKII